MLVVVPLERRPRQHQVYALIYEIAAELAKRSDEIDGEWIISAHPYDHTIVVEIVSDADLPSAVDVIRRFAQDFDLGLR